MRNAVVRGAISPSRRRYGLLRSFRNLRNRAALTLQCALWRCCLHRRLNAAGALRAGRSVNRSAAAARATSSCRCAMACSAARAFTPGAARDC
ncbi:hypothetical protein [Xanthomonas bundabergensis]|uniref:hypothetical protein n=1 Tax=Xanthomonas bundabergensis TaxID=3160842 RepID=UPI0035130541